MTKSESFGEETQTAEIQQFTEPSELDRKFQGEICQFEGRDLPNLSPEFAVKVFGGGKVL
ncbi:MAG: hypothetical protein IJ928_05340 [Prevotella sp.]|nr:hypothetical protein [Prevotella sp.]